MIAFACSLMAQSNAEIANEIIRKASQNKMKVEQLDDFIHGRAHVEMFVTLTNVTDNNFDSVSYILRNAYCGFVNIVIADNPNFTRIPDNWIYENNILKNFNLRSLILPNSVRYIGTNAFFKCLNLQTLMFSDTKKGKLKLGENPFNQCESLKYINFLSMVDSLPRNLFWGCSSLNISELPDNIKAIGAKAFGFCDSIRSIRMPKYLERIDSSMFFFCRMLESVEVSPNTRIIEPGAFSRCYNLKNLDVLKYTDVIKRNTFVSCGFKQIAIPDNIKKIESGAFANSEEPESIRIPKSVTEIADSAFMSMQGLVDVVIDGHPKIGVCNFTCRGSEASRYVIVYVEPQYVEEYRKLMPEYTVKSKSEIGKLEYAEELSSLADRIASCKDGELALKINFATDENLLRISKAIAGASAVIDLDLSQSDGLTSIAGSDFYGVGNLRSVILPNTVSSIGERAFLGCDTLQSIIIPNNVDSIGESAFSGCRNLKEIKLPKKLRTISKYMLYECYALESVEIPEGVTSIGNDAFHFDSSLVNIVIPKTVERIGCMAFSCCQSIKSITIPDKVTQLEYSTFFGCHSMKTLTIPKSVTKVGGMVTMSKYKMDYVMLEGNPEIKDDSFMVFGFRPDTPIRVHKKYIEDYKAKFPKYKFEPIER